MGHGLKNHGTGSSVILNKSTVSSDPGAPGGVGGVTQSLYAPAGIGEGISDDALITRGPAQTMVPPDNIDMLQNLGPVLTAPSVGPAQTTGNNESGTPSIVAKASVGPAESTGINESGRPSAVTPPQTTQFVYGPPAPAHPAAGTGTAGIAEYNRLQRGATTSGTGEAFSQVTPGDRRRLQALLLNHLELEFAGAGAAANLAVAYNNPNILTSGNITAPIRPGETPAQANARLAGVRGRYEASQMAILESRWQIREFTLREEAQHTGNKERLQELANERERAKAKERWMKEQLQQSRPSGFFETIIAAPLRGIKNVFTSPIKSLGAAFSSLLPSDITDALATGAGVANLIARFNPVGAAFMAHRMLSAAGTPNFKPEPFTWLPKPKVYTIGGRQVRIPGAARGAWNIAIAASTFSRGVKGQPAQGYKYWDETKNKWVWVETLAAVPGKAGTNILVLGGVAAGLTGAGVIWNRQGGEGTFPVSEYQSGVAEFLLNFEFGEPNAQGVRPGAGNPGNPANPAIERWIRPGK